MAELFFDCTHGIHKDTFASSLIALLPDPQAFMGSLEALDIPGCRFDLLVAQDRGVFGVHLAVRQKDHEAQAHGHDVSGHAHGAHEHPHHSVEEVHHIIEHAGLPEEVREHVLGVYDIIAAAEAAAHGVDVSEVHFHEVGNHEAIAYICAASMAFVQLDVEGATASSVCTGFGFVDCAHGRLPIPAPATANILADVPTFAGNVEGELTTPTGAALVKHFASSFGDMPSLVFEAFGFGVGPQGLDSKSTMRTVLGSER